MTTDRGGSVPKAQVSVSSDGTVSCSIEETNRIRAALGLKPLQISPEDQKRESTPASSSSSSSSSSTTTMTTEKEDLAVQERLEWARLRRKQRELMRTRSLGAPDENEEELSAGEWVTKQRETSQIKRERELAERKQRELDEMEQALDGDDDSSAADVDRTSSTTTTTNKITAAAATTTTTTLRQRSTAQQQKKGGDISRRSDTASSNGRRGLEHSALAGMKVAHDKASIREGEEVILTLRDRSILKEEDGGVMGLDEDADELENVHLLEEERRKWVRSQRKSAQAAYNAVDELLESSEQHNSKHILPQYDADRLSFQRKSFELTASTQSNNNNNKNNKDADTRHHDGDSTTAAHDKIVKQFDKAGAEKADSDESRRARLESVRSKLRKSSASRTTTTTSIPAAAPPPPPFSSSSKSNTRTIASQQDDNIDDDDDDDDFHHALFRARRLEEARRGNKSSAQLVLEQAQRLRKSEQEELSRQQSVESRSTQQKEDEAAMEDRDQTAEKDVIVLNPMEEFVKNIDPMGGIFGSQDNRRSTSRVLSARQSAATQLSSSAIASTSTSVPPDYEETPRPEEEVDVEMSAATTTTTTTDQSRSGQPISADSNHSDEDRMSDDGNEKQEQEGEADEGGDDVFDEPIAAKGISSALAFAQARGLIAGPELAGRNRHHDQKVVKDRGSLKVEHMDKYGRVMTPKEAFRELCHKFHGKFPGKNKRERERKHYLQELRAKKLVAANQDQLMKNFKKAQAAIKQPYVVVQGGTSAAAAISLAEKTLKNKKKRAALSAALEEDSVNAIKRGKKVKTHV